MLSPSLLAALSMAVAPVPEPAQFSDWTVACDNVRRCEALAAFERADRGNEWTIHVIRGADAYSSLKVEAFRPFNGPMAAAQVRIDGRLHNFGFDSDGSLIGETTAFLAALARGRRAEVVAANGNVIGTLPVAGASAAVRWIDDQQKRAGAVTAIIARGVRPGKSVPPPPPLPRISQPPVSEATPQRLNASEIKAIRAISDYCEQDARGVDTYRLDAMHTVGIVGCFMGAYQGPSVIVVIDEDGRWTPAKIERPESLPESFDSSWQYLLTGAAYSEDDRLLRKWSKGRGLADCGSSASWAWDGEMFRLASYRSLDECRGTPPGIWLSRWQSANDPLQEGE